MGLIKMTVYPRSTSGKNANRRTRISGRTPAVVYGDKREHSSNVELDTVELRRAMAAFSGSNPLFSLSLDGKGEPFVAVMREMQTHPVSEEIYHCDLFAIPLGKPLKMEVALDIHGENRHIRSGDAVLDVVRRSIEIECLPRDVPDTIDVDFSELAVGDKINVADLSLESGTILTDDDEVVLKLNLNTFEEEATAAADAGDAEADAEGEEGDASGEAHAAGDAPKAE
ncbi:50S ribosomal protein L25 [bacterium]|nr:50S ribosomal protein L25 [bacterium]MBU1072722.1 50S ribosomal protein L25 [bacterium]MBU1676116.1 50S ribosomal protein L25 [bacterium]